MKIPVMKRSEGEKGFEFYKCYMTVKEKARDTGKLPSSGQLLVSSDAYAWYYRLILRYNDGVATFSTLLKKVFSLSKNGLQKSLNTPMKL